MDSLLSKYIKIFFVVALYWFTSILMVFVNKALLSKINLEAPLFITWSQCVITVVLSILIKLANRTPFKTLNVIRKDICYKMLPVSILFTSMIATNNLCLKYVDVSFYYIGRSLTTVFNVIFSYILLKQLSSWKCISCCALIIFGFLLGVDQESLTETFSLAGTVFGILGSLSLSLYSIYMKKALPKVDQDVILLGYYLNFYSCCLFLPLMYFNEEFSEIYHYESLDKLWFWGALCVGGICGFAIGFVTVLQIKVTSPLTHNISGTAKACAQTVIATQWFNETKSFLWWSSNAIVLLGSALYTRVRQVEMEEKYKKQFLARQSV